MKRLPFGTPDEILAATVVARETVAAGGVVLLPTESFYGLAADPRLEPAIAAIRDLKGRPSNLGMPVLCADWQQLERLVTVPEAFRIKLSRIWPAPLTVVLPSVDPIAAAVEGTLAVRIPGHRGLRALLYRCGPLTGTSANRHGDPPCVTVDDALESMIDAPELVLDGGATAGGEASTIVDLTGDSPRILRSGGARWDDPIPDC